MKREKKVVYGIEITKPWSKAMYDHNDQVAEVVRTTVHLMWIEAMTAAAFAYGVSVDELVDFDWDQASGEMKNIQKAVTCYGFGHGYTIGRVADTVGEEIEDAPFYRLNDIAEELGLELEKGFVGFN